MNSHDLTASAEQVALLLQVFVAINFTARIALFENRESCGPASRSKVISPRRAMREQRHDEADEKNEDHDREQHVQQPEAPAATPAHHSVSTIPHHVQSSTGMSFPLPRSMMKRRTSEPSLVTISSWKLVESFSVTGPGFR